MPVASALIGSGQRCLRFRVRFRLGAGGPGRAGPGAIMPVEQDSQLLGFVGGNAEDDPRRAPWLFQRVAT